MNTLRNILSVSLTLAFLPSLTACRKPADRANAGGMPATQVVAVEARRQPVSEILSLVGSVTANEIVEIKTEADGMVEELPFQEGQAVKKGDLLVRLDETKWTTAVAEAEANFQLSRANFERTKQLFGDKLVAQSEFDQAAAAFHANEATLDLRKRLLKDTRIYAPFNGVLGARNISPGQVISKNTTLTWLVDLDPVKVEVNVPEHCLSQIATGQSIEFGVAAFPNDRFQGEVFFIAPQLDPATRTALVKARVPNPAHKLKGGMFANLALTLMLRDSAIVVPEPALVSNGDTVTVFVVDEKSAAQVRPVKVGLRLAGRAEVITGLQAGEKVVVEGVQKLFPGAPVKLAPAAAAAPYLN